MFQMKNCIAYLVHDLPDVQAIESALQGHKFTPRGRSELSSTGWSEPAPKVSDDLAYEAHGWILVALKTQEADLKASVIKDALNEKVEAIERQQFRKVYRKEKQVLKDEVILDMLPRAFDKNRTTHALINPESRYLFVDAASHTKAEELLSALREALGTLKCEMISTEIPATKVLTGWVNDDYSHERLLVGDSCQMIDPMSDGGKVVIKGQDLHSDEVTAHIAGGYIVDRLSIDWDQCLSFSLHSDLSIHRFRLSDEYSERIDADAPEDMAAAIESDIWRCGQDLTRLMDDITDAMGGCGEFELKQEKDGV